MASLAVLFAYHLLSSIIFKFCNCQDTLIPSQSLKLGRTLVSSNGTFELGFFTPDAYTNSSWYLGLWYTKITPKNVVWIANREFPLYDTFGAMNFTRQGVLVIFSSTNSVVWSSKVSTIAKDPVLQLLDSGNLVVKERFGDDPDHYIWQSFDYICDTLLPGMKLGRNFSSGLEWYMSSWKSSEDPAPGIFSVRIDVHGYPQLVVKNGSRVQYRVGPWSGITFTGTPFLKPTSMLTMTFEMNDQVVYFKFKFSGSSDLTRFALDTTGLVQRYVWSDQSHDWVVIATAETDDCENYALCGAYGSCNISRSPICACLDGFISRSPKEWNSSNWSGGCVRRTPLDCEGKDGFLKLGGIKLPDTSDSWFNRSVSLKECEGLCLRNCSCTAYTSLDIRGSGCLHWYGEIVDVRALSEGGQDLYVRLAASELDSIQQPRPTSRRKNRGLVIAISVVLAVAILVVGLVLCLLGTGNLKTAMVRKRVLKHEILGGMEEGMEMPIFDLATIEEATKNFSSVNKLGEGGFGPVYKGKLSEGKEIAVKRLSKISSQGLNEFKTEVMVISKLQHRNLVRLLGCCIHEDEKMLIYEYMPNKSLDDFIFDKTRSKLLDWHMRFCIIEGIARGLLYLHQDSRLRIIHRDLKASNILLDDHMNPKISDFGLARTFGADQTEANTDTVVGTVGYMAPEYAMDGHFSMKSDVFSFGVLILEIISGRKNQRFFHPGHDFNLIGHAWMLWNKGTPLELIDEHLAYSCTPFEVIRCIHVALLCVQQRPWDRPFLSTMVLMLGSDNQLPEPTQPGFSMGSNPVDARNALWSENDISETVLEAR